MPLVPLALGLCVRLTIAFLSLDFLLAHIVPDDTFYYLTIARNVVHTGVFTFDGIAPTNGFHPLWQIVLIPIAAINLTPEATLRLVLVLLALIESGTIVGLHRLVGRLGGSASAATTGAMLYALSPVVLTQAGGMNGMETAVASMMFVLFLNVSARALVDGSGPLPASALALASALLVIARLDMAIPTAVIYGALLWVYRRDGFRFRRIAAAGCVPVAALGAFLAINAFVFGHPLPVSAQSIAWMARDYLGVEHWGLGQWAFRIGANLTWTPRYVPFGLSAIHATIVVTASLAAVGALLTSMYRWDFRGTRWSRGARVLLSALAASWVVFIVVQTFRIPLMRSWYHGLWIVPAVLFASRLYEALCGRQPVLPTRRIIWWSFGTALILLGSFNAFQHEGRDSTKLHMAEAALRVLPTGSIIGSWNSGTMAFFAPTLRVINLDGVVNNVAWTYIERRRLVDYVRGVGIAYLADDLGSFSVWGAYWTPRGSSLAGLGHRLTSIPIPDGSDTIVLVRLPQHLP